MHDDAVTAFYPYTIILIQLLESYNYYKVNAAITYNVTADDVVFTKSFTKICKLTVFRFLSCSTISKRERFFT